MQDCSNYSALALELLQSCTKPSIFSVRERNEEVADLLTSLSSLTHLPLDKMAAKLANGIFKDIFLNENDKIQIPIPLTFVPMSPIDNKSALL